MRWATALAGLAIVPLYTVGLGSFPLAEPDEARYAEIAREMLVLGEWITPHLNFVRYFDKPPLVFWATALAFRAFGLNEWAARLPSLIGGLTGIALTFALARSAYGQPVALLAAVILATAPLYCLLGQTLTADMTLTALLTLGLTAFWYGHQRESDHALRAPEDRENARPKTPLRHDSRERVRVPRNFRRSRWWYRAAYVAVGLGVLAKGPVAALIVGGVAGLFLVLQRDWAGLRRAVDPLGIALFLLIVLPWYAAVSWRNPEYLRYFVVEQHLRRYLTPGQHVAPFWYFVPVLPLALFPWGVLCLLDPAAWRSLLAPRQWSAATRFFLLWAGFVVAFFSISGSKLVTYVLPALPPLAILLARFFAQAADAGRFAVLRRGGTALLGLGVGIILLVPLLGLFVTHWRFPLMRPYLYAAGAVFVVSGTATLLTARARRAAACVAVLAAGTFAWLAVGLSARGLATSYRSLGLAARAALQPGDRLAVYRHSIQAIPFYSGHRVILVGPQRPKFGEDPSGVDAYFWSDDRRLFEEWRSAERLFLVINRSELESLRRALEPPPIVVAAEGKKLLLVNHPLGN